MDTAEIQVPTFISGIISKLTGPDYCMDGATHVIRSMNGVTRLKGNRSQVTAQLNKFAGKRIRVTVAGYPVFGPECSHLNVYYAAPTQDIMQKIVGTAKF
jgi:hypothetical protein